MHRSRLLPAECAAGSARAASDGRLTIGSSASIRACRSSPTRSRTVCSSFHSACGRARPRRSGQVLPTILRTKGSTAPLQSMRCRPAQSVPKASASNPRRSPSRSRSGESRASSSCWVALSSFGMAEPGFRDYDKARGAPCARDEAEYRSPRHCSFGNSTLGKITRDRGVRTIPSIRHVPDISTGQHFP